MLMAPSKAPARKGTPSPRSLSTTSPSTSRSRATWAEGYSDFHNWTGFTSKKMLNNILKKCLLTNIFSWLSHFLRICILVVPKIPLNVGTSPSTSRSRATWWAATIIPQDQSCGIHWIRIRIQGLDDQKLKAKNTAEIGFFFFFYVRYSIPHCFICRPSDSTVSEDAGIEPRTVATSALAVRRFKH
jgi:hypothetical protein